MKINMTKVWTSIMSLSQSASYVSTQTHNAQSLQDGIEISFQGREMRRVMTNNDVYRYQLDQHTPEIILNIEENSNLNDRYIDYCEENIQIDTNSPNAPSLLSFYSKLFVYHTTKLLNLTFSQCGKLINYTIQTKDNQRFTKNSTNCSKRCQAKPWVLGAPIMSNKKQYSVKNDKAIYITEGVYACPPILE